MRVLVSLSLSLLALALPATALAAPPTRERIDMNEPWRDADESAWATDWCGFPIVAEVSGHIDIMVHDKTGPGTFEKASYHIYITHRNPANGKRFTVRDVGPDRLFVKDGRVYVAVTGRSEGGTGHIGVMVFDLETNELVHQGGRDIGLYWDHLCEALD